jgi:hypothetical protein
MNFSRSRKKVPKKNVLQFFRKLGSKESWGTTEDKVTLRQPDILKF